MLLNRRGAPRWPGGVGAVPGRTGVSQGVGGAAPTLEIMRQGAWHRHRDVEDPLSWFAQSRFPRSPYRCASGELDWEK